MAVVEPTLVPSRKTVYPVTPTLSVDCAHEIEMLVLATEGSPTTPQADAITRAAACLTQIVTRATRPAVVTLASGASTPFALGTRQFIDGQFYPDNRSLAVIGRLGFRFEGIAREAEWCDGRWLDHAVFALLATDPR